MPGRRQAIIRTIVGILLNEPLETNFSEILIEIIIFSVKKMHLKMTSGNWWPFCLGLNELLPVSWVTFIHVLGKIGFRRKPLNIISRWYQRALLSFLNYVVTNVTRWSKATDEYGKPIVIFTPLFTRTSGGILMSSGPRLNIKVAVLWGALRFHIKYYFLWRSGRSAAWYSETCL